LGVVPCPWVGVCAARGLVVAAAVGTAVVLCYCCGRSVDADGFGEVSCAPGSGCVCGVRDVSVPAECASGAAEAVVAAAVICLAGRGCDPARVRDVLQELVACEAATGSGGADASWHLPDRVQPSRDGPGAAAQPFQAGDAERVVRVVAEVHQVFGREHPAAAVAWQPWSGGGCFVRHGRTPLRPIGLEGFLTLQPGWLPAGSAAGEWWQRRSEAPRRIPGQVSRGPAKQLRRHDAPDPGRAARIVPTGKNTLSQSRREKRKCPVALTPRQPTCSTLTTS
jgi:hypothetical protein